MLDHVFVHSVFGIQSSFEFRISSFSRSFRTINYQPTTINCSGPGLTRNPSGHKRHQTGLNGTDRGLNGTGKGRLFSPVADTHTTHNRFANSLLFLKPSKPRTPDILSQGTIHRDSPFCTFHFAFCILPGTFNAHGACSVGSPQHFGAIRPRSWGDSGEISGALWGRFFQPHPPLGKLTTHFQGDLYARHPPHHSRQRFLLRHPQPGPGSFVLRDSLVIRPSDFVIPQSPF